MRPRVPYVLVGIVVLIVTSCNFPLNPALGAPAPGLNGTSAARAGSVASGLNTVTSPPVPVTGGIGTPVAVEVTVSSPTNCRTGPGVVYDLVFLAPVGQGFAVVGKYTPGNYWIIAAPSGGTCWLWGRYAVLSGNTDALPEVSPPPSSLQGAPSATGTGAGAPTPTDTLGPPPTDTPTPTAAPTIPPVLPSAPGNLSESYVCSLVTGSTADRVQDISLTWKDSAYETGYRIYQNGTALTTLPQNSNSYHVQLRYSQSTGGAANAFGVEAYNNAGASQRLTIDVPRCP